jgi:pimeloyl-ACP methyl ester carboxylesterase
MVKKTLLSLAIAASTAGLTACNISSTADSNEVATDPVLAGQPGQQAASTAVIFSAARGNLPVNTDFLFASASATDGTASLADTAPPVTNMINDLAGFSATASIDLAFTAALDPATVIAGSSVWLVELKSKEDNSLIDALDLASIIEVAPANPFADGEDQLVPGQDYLAEYVTMDNGATPTIRIHPLKPLDPKTKYIVIVTDKLKDANGITVVSSSEYAHTSSNDELVSASLAPVRAAVQGWEQLAGGFLTAATAAAQTQDNVILSYAFTTEANDDILLSMAAPENYISNLLTDTKTLEGLLGADTVALLVAGTAQLLNATNAATEGWVDIDPSTEAGTLAARNTPEYKDLVTKTVAQSILGSGAAQGAVDALTAGGAAAAQVNGAFAIWNGTAGNEDKQIPADPATWTSVHYDYIARALGTYSDATDTATYIALASNGAGALLKDAAHRPASRDFVAIAGGSGIVNIPHDATGLNLTNPYATSMQGMLTLPQFMAKKSADGGSFWKSRDTAGTSSVGDVIDGAFGNEASTTPPKDDDDTNNVTYRFPFAQWIEDIKVPVLVTYPTAGGGCTKPVDGWPVVIFQHGITTDRTASLGFANSMAAAATGCFATVAMDLPTHGVDASTTDRNGTATRYSAFNAFNVAGYTDANPLVTPFASTLAGLADADDTTYTGLAERHENLALNALQQPVAMNFTVGEESGNSGDMFINLTNMQQTRDHIRQAVMDMLNLNASIANMDIDGAGAGDLDEDNIHFVGHSLGAITGLTYAAVNNAVAADANIADKDINLLKTVVLANPGGQLPKLLENSPSFSLSLLPGLAASGLTQGMADLEKFFGVFQAPLDSADPVNFTDLLKSTNTPVLMFEMVGGGLIDAVDSNLDENAGKVTGLPDTLIGAGGYPADTVVPNNANPALNSVATGLSYLAGTDPLVSQLELASVTGSIAPDTANLMLVSKLKEGTHGTISSGDAVTVFAEMVGQAASFFATAGKGLTVTDAAQLQVPAE